MKYINKFLLGSLLALSIACDNDLDQVPSNVATSDSLTDFGGVVNAAYYYQFGANTPLAVMGDFRADNMNMSEAPYTDYHTYNANLKSMEDQFFLPLYATMYQSILSANIVINNATDEGQIAEAKFLRGLSYFKLILAFGDVSINLSDAPSLIDFSDFDRRPAATVYNNVVIPDLMDAIADLDNSLLTGGKGRASNLAAKAILGKVYMHMGDFASAEPILEEVINEAAIEGVVLATDFADVIVDEGVETIFVTERSTSFADPYNFSELTDWYGGTEDKARLPLDSDLTAAFDDAGDTERKALTIDDTLLQGAKYNGNAEQDWIEIRLSDVVLLHAEALNENSNASGADSDSILGLLDDIRTRAGLASLVGTAATQAEVRQAIADERRLELALEGHRWFDLVRTGTVEAELGETVNANYHVFPVPEAEIVVTSGIITQNAGY